LNVMVMDIGQRRAFFAPAPDSAAAVHVRVEPGMPRTFPTPSHAADLEHRIILLLRDYFTAAAGGAAGGTAGGEDTR
jgi:hypothetical protein